LDTSVTACAGPATKSVAEIAAAAREDRASRGHGEPSEVVPVLARVSRI
jgi:hypothetical protein